MPTISYLYTWFHIRTWIQIFILFYHIGTNILILKSYSVFFFLNLIWNSFKQLVGNKLILFSILYITFLLDYIFSNFILSHVIYKNFEVNGEKETFDFKTDYLDSIFYCWTVTLKDKFANSLKANAFLWRIFWIEHISKNYLADNIFVQYKYLKSNQHS